jgi:hypothetical protein
VGYYIRVLSPSETPVPPAILEKFLAADGRLAIISGDTDSADWQQLTVSHANGNEVCSVERFPVSTEIGRDEIDQFLEEVDDYEPKSGAVWLTSYFSSVKTVYIIQIFSGTYEEGGWDIVGSIKSALWNQGGGIIQADFEGFSNEDGYHILWQFSDKVSGDWWMAVLDNGK